MRNIKLVIEYDGTNYGGWQKQTNALSIQQVLEEAIERLTGERVAVIGSGRTDSGVHARGQTANFHTNSSIPSKRFCYALNSVLPSDIRVLVSKEVGEDFHARYSAIGKRYRYSMVVNKHGIAIARQYFWHIRSGLDIEAIGEAAEYFRGTHDFSAFQATGSSVKTSVRTIFMSNLIWQDPYLYYDVKGNGFLYNMVRIMVGTLVEVGRGKLKPADIHGIIQSRDRSQAGPTAPAHGLCLEEVYYE